MIVRRSALGRLVPFLIAILQVAPSVQWCGVSWADVSPECMVRCVVSNACTTGEDEACAKRMAVEGETCPLDDCADSIDLAGAMGLPDDVSPTREGRAWCPETATGARPTSIDAGDEDPPATIHGTDTLPAPRTARPRFALLDSERPRCDVTRASPPIRAPPSSLDS